MEDRTNWPGPFAQSNDGNFYQNVYGWIAQSQVFSNWSERIDSPDADAVRFGTVLMSRRQVCGCLTHIFPNPEHMSIAGRSLVALIELVESGVQLLVTAVLAVRTRPRGPFSGWSDFYFVCAFINNFLMHHGLTHLCCIREASMVTDFFFAYRVRDLFRVPHPKKRFFRVPGTRTLASPAVAQNSRGPRL